MISALFALALLFGFGNLLWGQAMPHIATRFTNPRYNAQTGIYSVDVELRADEPAQQLFGMNVRFFFDPTQLTFLHFDDFREGYALLGEAPESRIGDEVSGRRLFNFGKSAAYINSAVQLRQETASVEIGVKDWTRFFRVNFLVADALRATRVFCPCLIWDMKADAEQGGFFRGSNGLVITVAEHNKSTRHESAPAKVQGLPFNWMYNQLAEMPYGLPLADNCISLAGTLTPNHEIAANNYQLLQNHPNPFLEHTTIEFVLPSSARAKLSFFDVTGSLVRELEGDFNAGLNAVQLKRTDLVLPAGVLMYRLETSEFTSGMKKMILVSK